LAKTIVEGVPENAFFKRLLTMIAAAQVFEKNHFLGGQNRATNPAMNIASKLNRRVMLLFLAAGLALAILAPVAVLAASF
jgi:hypothetical protein